MHQDDFSSDDSLADCTYKPNKDIEDYSTDSSDSDGKIGKNKQSQLENIVETSLALANNEELTFPVQLGNNSHPHRDEILPPSEQVHQAKQKKSATLQLLNPCSCKKKCWVKFSEQRRQAIFDQFKNMNFAQRQFFFEAYVLQKKKQFHSASKKRTYTYVYQLPLDAENTKQLVCKTMFLHTIGRKTDGLITEFFRRRKENAGLVSSLDHRGGVVNRIKLQKSALLHNQIRDHILKFHPQVSHYKLDHAPNRRYLPSDITIKFMWNDFNEKFGMNVASYVTYTKIFRKENIGFDTPSQDECPVCEEYQQHRKELMTEEPAIRVSSVTTIHNENTETAHQSDSCTKCTQFNNHKLNYIEARKMYKFDKAYKWPQTTNVFTADMQKVIIIPKMKSKNSFFVSRLVVFNETFAPLHQHDPTNLCVLWHEAITGRTASDVASAFVNVIEQSRRDVSSFIFWADNCSAQNKNWILYSAFLIVVSQNWSPDTITIKYFEPGHSYMRADSVHGNIGRKWKKTNEVLDMDDLVQLIKKTDVKNECRLLNESNFYNFKNICHKRSKKYDIPLLNNLEVVEFRRGSTNLFYKYKHDSDTFNVFENITNLKELKFPDKKTEPAGMNAAKKKKFVNNFYPKCQYEKESFGMG